MKSNKLFQFTIAVVVLLVGGCTTGLKQTGEITMATPKALATATPKQMAQLRTAMLTATTMRSIQAPSYWSQQRRWSPRRHFGPLYGSSPDIHLNGEGANFVYNRFFTGHPDAAVFQKYYGPTLPSNQPSLAEAIPGTLPNSGFRDVRLSFDQLTYSSRYGGSFKLTFRSLEDLQVEYRKADKAWDIASLEIAVYVRPVPTLFNPNAPLYSVPNGNVHVEFRPQGIIAYTLTNGILTVQKGDPLPALLTALAESAQAIVGASPAESFRRDATRFSHGLVHAAFWEEIGQTNNVTAIEISDGFFFPRTTAGRPVAVVSVQISDVRLDTESGGEEIYITLDAAHEFQGVSIPPTFSWELPEIDNRGSTGWTTVGVFPLDWDCGQLQTVILMLSIREEDDVSDDRFVTDPRAFQTGALECSGMQIAFNNGQFGFYRNLPDEQLVIVQDDEVAGALTARMRISVIKQ